MAHSDGKPFQYWQQFLEGLASLYQTALLVLDLMLPGVAGFEVVIKLRNRLIIDEHGSRFQSLFYLVAGPAF